LVPARRTVARWCESSGLEVEQRKDKIMFYIVIIDCWASSASDDSIRVFLENANSPEDAKAHARKRLDWIESEDQILSIDVKAVNAANIGMIFAE
jgi:hypothetical protein